ncbi:MAG: hypothetical protein JNN04_14765 [Cyclobacteriaceae bacterium]|nr:hypothetical protein [Cyclobacteriaceae bacterium]
MYRNTLILLIVLLTFGGKPGHAQDVRVNGFFSTDSAAIGEVIPYVLTASYPNNVQVLFPDSTYQFTPFESAGKRYFPTRTTGTISHDSVVYFLSTFELDSIQALKLPVFIVQKKDCLAVYAPADSLRLKFKVTMPLDSIAVDKLPLKANTAYQRVRQLFNYPVFLIGLAIVAVLALAAWLIFGKRIRQYFRLRRLQRNYRNFLSRFSGVIDRMGTTAPGTIAEEALWIWKKYMEDLEEYPFTKSTSREIVRRYSNDELARALRTIDRGIYGGYGTPPDPFRYLQDYSRQQFEKREAAIKHG